MAKRISWVVGVLGKKDGMNTIKYVTKTQNHPSVAHWEDGKPAEIFSKTWAEDVALGLCMNGYPAIVMIKPDYLELVNTGKPKEETEK